MNRLDPSLQIIALIIVKPLLTLAVFAGVGSFSLGAFLLPLEEEWKKKVGSNLQNMENEQD